jgi:hypothetical protein
MPDTSPTKAQFEAGLASFEERLSARLEEGLTSRLGERLSARLEERLSSVLKELREYIEEPVTNTDKRLIIKGI